MNPNEVAFAKNMFKLKIHELNGKAFETFFVKIMQENDPDFRPIKPHGAKGDRKNDGYNKREKRYFQVFSPEDVASSQKDAIKKLKNDFSGLNNFWNQFGKINEYFFVFNDKYFGPYPDFEVVLEKIKNKYNLKEADVFLAHDLEKTLFSLSDDKIISIIGHIPNLNIDEFHILSGITYFLGVWINFERTCREYAIKYLKANKYFFPTPIFLKDLETRAILNKSEYDHILYFRDIRNRFVHGDEYRIPMTSEIDNLVLITQRISKLIV